MTKRGSGLENNGGATTLNWSCQHKHVVNHPRAAVRGVHQYAPINVCKFLEKDKARHIQTTTHKHKHTPQQSHEEQKGYPGNRVAHIHVHACKVSIAQQSNPHARVVQSGHHLRLLHEYRTSPAVEGRKGDSMDGV